MGLKRKRSSDFTYSPSSNPLSSPSQNPWQAALSRPETDTQMELNFLIVKHSSFGDDSGRTRKRWRDRPNEHIIQNHTVQKLFDAQRQRPNAEPILSHDQPPPVHQTELPQKSTLHAFWNIRQPQPIFAIPTLSGEPLGVRCEECDRALKPSDGPDSSMGMYEDMLCIACGRQVCDYCTVNRDGRKCLGCVQER